MPARISTACGGDMRHYLPTVGGETGLQSAGQGANLTAILGSWSNAGTNQTEVQLDCLIDQDITAFTSRQTQMHLFGCSATSDWYQWNLTGCLNCLPIWMTLKLNPRPWSLSFQGSNCKRPSKAVEVCLSTLAGETSDLARAMDRRKHFANIQSKCEPVGMTSNGSTTLKLKLTMIGLLAWQEETETPTDFSWFAESLSATFFGNWKPFQLLHTVAYYCILLLYHHIHMIWS